MAEMWTREIGSVGEGEGGSKGGDRESRDSRRGSRARTGRCQLASRGGRAGRDTFRFAPNGIYGIIGSGHSRSSHRRCSATRSGTTSRASCSRWSRTAGRPRLSRVPSTRRRPSPSRPTDELRPLSPSSDHPPFNPNRRDVSRAGLLALSRIRAHELSRFPRLSDPRFPSLGGNELTGGSVRVDAARGSSRTKLPNLVVFAEARVARFVSSVLDTAELLPRLPVLFPRLLNISKGRIRQEPNLVDPSLIPHGCSVRGKA